MARISTHVLDIAAGKPAIGIQVEMYLGLAPKAITQTNGDGRTDEPLVNAERLETGEYNLIFLVGDYFRTQGLDPFYERVSINFVVTDDCANYHIPLLLARHGYSTYRGS